MTSPKSASTLNNYFSFGGYPEPQESSTPSALDLCIKSKKRSPSPEGASHFNRYETLSNNNNNNNSNITNNNVPENKKMALHITIPNVPTCRTPDSQASSETSENYCHPESSICSPYSNGNATPKPSRPFKAYPKALLATPDVFVDPVSMAAYNEFRKQMLAQVSSSTTNKNMRRTHGNNNNIHVDDPHYWEKRRKNNEAAKRSRDARRAKEDEMAIRCAFLERENIRLKCEIAALKSQIENSRTYYNYA